MQVANYSGYQTENVRIDGTFLVFLVILVIMDTTSMNSSPINA